MGKRAIFVGKTKGWKSGNKVRPRPFLHANHSCALCSVPAPSTVRPQVPCGYHVVRIKGCLCFFSPICKQKTCTMLSDAFSLNILSRAFPDPTHDRRNYPPRCPALGSRAWCFGQSPEPVFLLMNPASASWSLSTYRQVA